MDNAPWHNQAAVFSYVNLVRLPLYCSSMDQGVIWSLKCTLRKHLRGCILSLIENEQVIMKAEVDVLMDMRLVKKAGFKPTLIQSVMQPPKDKCDLIEDFTHYVSTDDRLFEEEIVYLEFMMEKWVTQNYWIKSLFKSSDEFVSNQAKNRKEDEYEAVSAPEAISMREAQTLLDQLKLFALANARSWGRSLECTIYLNSAFVDFQRRAKLRQTKIYDFSKNTYL
ncbi:unnamed protein product [Echinostoma caproni]|uniref:DDE-1 domain-containing protein n=1 Tax=Echinostoma caproni TaxID=27848 RepID=A0A183ADS6_9TREM|nr:unnamed protein product [Echinostoma caproni]